MDARTIEADAEYMAFTWACVTGLGALQGVIHVCDQLDLGSELEGTVSLGELVGAGADLATREVRCTVERIVAVNWKTLVAHHAERWGLDADISEVIAPQMVVSLSQIAARTEGLDHRSSTDIGALYETANFVEQVWNGLGLRA